MVTLTRLEELKAEHNETFKAARPTRREIDQECADLLCPYALRKINADREGVLWIKKGHCTNKRCPKERTL